MKNEIYIFFLQGPINSCTVYSSFGELEYNLLKTINNDNTNTYYKIIRLSVKKSDGVYEHIKLFLNSDEVGAEPLSLGRFIGDCIVLNRSHMTLFKDDTYTKIIDVND